MIETTAQREKRIKAEAAIRAQRAAAYAKKMNPEAPEQPAEVSTVNTVDGTRLAILEKKIEGGIKQFLEVGEALAEIREKKLYLETHQTFEAYCNERWNIGRAHAYRMMDAADVRKNVSPLGDITQERQARTLKTLTPPDQRKAMKRAVKKNGPKPTAKEIEVEVEAIREEKLKAYNATVPKFIPDHESEAAASIERIRKAVGDEVEELTAEGIKQLAAFLRELATDLEAA